jgi:subtilisin family serine protease
MPGKRRIIGLGLVLGSTPLFPGQLATAEQQAMSLEAAVTAGSLAIQVDPDHPYKGSNVAIGLWDAGGVRTSHLEFGGRAMAMDPGLLNDNHATHGAGILISAGVNPLALGMAPEAEVLSFGFNDDLHELSIYGDPSWPERIAVSNHSYGFVRGWTFGTGTVDWKFNVADDFFQRQLEDPAFGQYNVNARDLDEVAFHAEYTLVFKPSGNDRVDGPKDGDRVYLSLGHANSNRVTIYDSSNPDHPKPDGDYRGGYGTITDAAIAKNIVTVGGVFPAQRDDEGNFLSGAAMTPGSSWGPVDSGRIKPDLVAQSDSILNAGFANDQAYNALTGTSQASASAAGAAALVWEAFDLPNEQRPLSSTVKAVLIHTADDLGTLGPDYQFGWGLINASAAINLLEDAKRSQSGTTILEGQLTSSQTSWSLPVRMPASGYMKATLTWLDPPSSATSQKDRHSSDLVHDLDLALHLSTGSILRPWIMPFALDSNSPLEAPATRAANNKDTVEQILETALPQGLHTLEISLANSLTTEAQSFSIVIEGVELPEESSALEIHDIEWTHRDQMRIKGSGFSALTGMEWKGEGLQPEILRISRQATVIDIRFREFLDDPMAGSLAELELSDPAKGAIRVPLTEKPEANPPVPVVTWGLTEENWATQDQSGQGNAWRFENGQASVTTSSQNGATAVSDVSLLSPEVGLPPHLDILILDFRHHFTMNYHSDTAWDGGVLEYSTDGENWHDAMEGGRIAPCRSGFNKPVSTRTLSLSNRQRISESTCWPSRMGWIRRKRKIPGSLPLA